MDRKRELIYFKNYYLDFYNAQKEKVKDKIDYVLFLVTVADRIPKKFFDQITGYEGLFEIRIEFESNIFRIFCCFDEGNLVILFNGFQKKTQKTPKKEIERAERIKEEYFEYKKKERKNEKHNNI
jgi:phage-related protein